MNIIETLIFGLGQFRHRVETIGLANSQYHVRIEQTLEMRRWGRGGGRDIAICGSLTAHFNLETFLVWASQDVVNGLTKYRTLVRCANSFGSIKYRINTRFLPIHRKFNTLLGNIVPITACLLGSNISFINIMYRILSYQMLIVFHAKGNYICIYI